MVRVGDSVPPSLYIFVFRALGKLEDKEKLYSLGKIIYIDDERVYGVTVK